MGVTKNSKTSADGFTLLELVVTVMIAGTLAAASVVMFTNGKARYQLSHKAQGISWQVERARSLAVKYNQTLTLGFTSQNAVFGITSSTCTDPQIEECSEARSELPPFRIPAGLVLSAYPTMSIRGNGTITVADGTIVVSDGQGRQVPITISNSGRTTVGDVSEESVTH